MSKEIQKQILDFFKIQQLLGSGAYGHVWKVKHKQNNKIYALKKVFDAFQNQVDSQRTYRQITILHQLDNEQIIKLNGVIKAQNDKDLYLIFQHVQTDLHALVGQNILEVPHLLYIIYQIFKGLKYLHSAQLIHRDLKPSNVLINSDCGIKLCDFGLVRSLTHQQNQPLILSQDVATRWYRSPQMLLGSQQYDWATDVWSVGCIMAQLIIGQPIMMGGSNIQQLQKILQLTGIPKKQDIQSLRSSCAQTLIQQFKIFKRPFKHYFKGSKYQQQTDLINLIKRMLQFNPKKRITVEQVLNHQLIADIRFKTQQKICNKVIIPQIDDNLRLTIDQYRKAIYKDIDRRYPQYKKVQQKQLSPQMKYQRAHNSLLNRTSSISSLTRLKPSNSLIRPTRNKIPYKQNNIPSLNKSIQHKSLHCNTVHNSYFYKKSQSNHKDSKFATSFHQTKSPFSQIQNKQKLSKQIAQNNQFIDKSPFKRHKKYQMQMNNQQIKKIEGLDKQQKSIQKVIKSSQKQNSINFTSYLSSNLKPKTTQHYLIKKNIYDPTVIYNQSPPKFTRSKQKNVYESMLISNDNKIVKKTFTRKKKDLTFQKYKDERKSVPNKQNTSYITVVEHQQK